ncbi:hypothetical protein D9M68_470480 [compost metagenome]
MRASGSRAWNHLRYTDAATETAVAGIGTPDHEGGRPQLRLLSVCARARLPWRAGRGSRKAGRFLRAGSSNLAVGPATPAWNRTVGPFITKESHASRH